MNALETRSDIIIAAHRLMDAKLIAEHEITPLHKHLFIKAVSNGIDEALVDFEHIHVHFSFIDSMVDVSFDIAKTIADNGGLVRTNMVQNEGSDLKNLL